MNCEKIKEAALKELEEEKFKSEVEKCKNKLKERKWWHKLLPYKIIITRR